MKIKILLDEYGFMPTYAAPGDAGADLRAALPLGMVTIYPGERKKICTGMRVAVPEGYEMQIRSRSGLAYSGIVVANSPGTIDSGYRGEIGVILCNISDTPYAVHHGYKIAQAVIAPVVRAEFELVSELDETERGEGGFGSTGVK